MKPFYLLSALLLASLLSHAQSFTVKIRVPDSFPIEKLVLSYGDGLNDIDVKREDISHSMVLKGDLHTQFGSLSLALMGEQMSFSSYELFFFGPGNSELVLKDTSLHPAKMVNIVNAATKGGKEFNEFTKAESARNKELLIQWNKLGKFDAELAQKITQSSIAFNRKSLEFIKQHPSSYYSFFQFYSAFTPFQQFIPADSLLQVYDLLPVAFKNTDAGKKVYRKLISINNIRDKHIAVDFRTRDVYGDSLSLAAFRGSYVILDFWATWCAPCMKAMPQLIEISEKYPAAKVISVSLDRDTTSHMNGIKKMPAAWKHIYNDGNIIDSYGVVGIPAVFLIDPEGKVLVPTQKEGVSDLDEIDAILKQANGMQTTYLVPAASPR